MNIACRPWNPPKEMHDMQLGVETAPEILDSISIPVTGTLPPYLVGRLYRNGPGAFELPHSDGSSTVLHHWVDGIGTVHLFVLDGLSNSVTYRSRRTMQGVIDSAASCSKSSYKNYFFGVQDPCQSLLGRLFQLWKPLTKNPDSGKVEQNINVTVQSIPGVSKVISRTDGSQAAILDPETLEMERAFDFRELHPSLTGASCAHGMTDPETGEYFNYTYKYGFSPVEYNIFKTNRDGQTEILARFRDIARYMHSFALTKKFVILLLFPISISIPKLVFTTAFVHALHFDKNSRTKIYVISREEGRVAAIYDAEPGFCFHTISSFDGADGDSVIIDLIRYESSDCLNTMYRQDFFSRPADFFTAPKPMRYTLRGLRNAIDEYAKDKKGPLPTAEEEVFSENSFELPNVNPEYTVKEHRYSYGVTHREGENNTLYSHVSKIDMTTRDILWWGLPRCSVGEPIFVPDPSGKKEDDGVILTVVLDPVNKNSFLAVLDARDMTEIARATVPQAVPFGFHGAFME